MTHRCRPQSPHPHHPRAHNASSSPSVTPVLKTIVKNIERQRSPTRQPNRQKLFEFSRNLPMTHCYTFHMVTSNTTQFPRTRILLPVSVSGRLSIVRSAFRSPWWLCIPVCGYAFCHFRFCASPLRYIISCPRYSAPSLTVNVALRRGRREGTRRPSAYHCTRWAVSTNSYRNFGWYYDADGIWNLNFAVRCATS